ncbi:MAG: HDOD domain-containing protein, partial [Phycisphaerales bacterium JB059]
MIARKMLKAADLPGLYGTINRKLDLVGIESQPAVAARLVELVQDPEAGPVDFAETVRHDAAISGRLLKLSNSAAFAQVKEVTSVDRACMLIGQERLRSMALGFYLSRSANDPEHESLSRRIWCESVLRGCVASELARHTGGVGVPEAFLVGLLLDAGVPMMNRMFSERYAPMADPETEPERRFQLEFDQLPMTHVDVGVALCQRWKLPEILGKAIAWHHTPPPRKPPETGVQRMQRIAYCVGLMGLGEGVSVEAFEVEARSRIGLARHELDDVCCRARSEYRLTIDMFDSVAERSPNVNALMDEVHQRLVDAHDQALISAAAARSEQKAVTPFRIGHADVEIEQTDR